MGNQGTKDWRLTAFFAIGLMLIAGLFGNAAIAADGDGAIVVSGDTILVAGSESNTVQFTYTANDVNMNGGSVRIAIPNGWKVPAAEEVQVKDGDNRLFLVGTPLAIVNPTVTASEGTADGPVQLDVGETIHSNLKDQRRVTFTRTRDGDYITAIEVKLDSESWDTDDNARLQITFIDTTVPIPDRLVYPNNDMTTQPYAEYTFITESKTKRGSFAPLNPTSGMPDRHPRVRVGNIGASVAGTVKITPEIAYEGEEYTFEIVFEALGPIYDWGNPDTATDTDIVVGVQSGVTLPAMTDANVSFPTNSTKGSVRFEDTPITFSGGVTTIHISQINKGNEVRIDYGPVTIGDPGGILEADQSAFTVSLSSDITGGRTQALGGSGTMTFTPPRNARVEVGAKGKTLAIKYTSAIALPSPEGNPLELEITVAGITTPLQQDAQVSAEPGYVKGSGSSTNRTLEVRNSTITWIWEDDLEGTNVSPFKRANATFTTTIQNVDIRDTSGKVEWTTSIRGAPLTNQPVLYIMNSVDNAVEFASDARSSYSAAEEDVTITFTFTAKSTIINDGKVEFSGIPWSPLPDPKGPAGKTTVTINYDGSTAEEVITEGIDYGRTVSVDVPDLAIDGTVTITYANFTMQSQATPADKPVEIKGKFQPSPSGSDPSAGTVEIDVTQVQDGYGEATIRATAANAATVKAGSNNNEIIVEFTAVGTMDGGAVSLQKPPGWGDFQDDDAKQANYVEVSVVRGGRLGDVNVTPAIVVARLEIFAPNAKLKFTYGDRQSGAEAQSDIGHAEFMIKSNGGGDSSFALVRGIERTAAEQEETPEPFGAVYRDDPEGLGILRVEVTGADDGSGSAEVTIEDTQQGEAEYPDNVEERRIHAGDTGTYLLFTYTPTETIENGQLKFQTNGEWSNPSNSSGTPGYTEIDGTGAANLGDRDFDENDNSVTVDIDEIEPDDTIEIHYGVYSGTDDGSGAHAPTSTATRSPFTISIKGGDADTNQLKAIKTPVTVRVYSQASGGGNASASVSDNKGDLGAGDADREVAVTYTAAGQISGGSLKLTIPSGWSDPTTETVDITSTGGTVNRSSAAFSDMDVTVGGVSLRAGGTVTFVYSAAMTQPTAGSAKFNVAVDGGSGPGEGPMAVTPDPSDATTIAVGDASPGSGSGRVVIEKPVKINSTGNTLKFIYTPSGAIADRSLDIRVEVPTGWSEPTARTDDAARGSFTITHNKMMEDGTFEAHTPAAVEKIGPFEREMAARLKPGSSLAAGDQVVFNFENVDAPATVGASTFTMFYGQAQVTNADLTVIVGSGKPATAIALTAPATHLVESTAPAAISVQLQDEDGSEVPAGVDTVVSLSSSSATGSFTVDGAAATSVTIAAGTTTATAGYADSTEGQATITASSGTLTVDTATITVTTANVMISSASSAITDSDGVVKTVARDGDTVTVTARANPNKTVTVMIETIFAAAVNMNESPAGTYTRSYTLAAGTQDGTYDITVALGAVSESAGSVAVDNTAPTISATSASPDTVANGDTVTISATVAGATSVMANVSLLDTAATASVSLTDADADGTYTGTHPISINNEARNGEQSITITATDAAGNSSDATATVTLQNSISFTSTLPAGISLFHVPLAEEGLDTVGDLRTKLGANVNLLITYDGSTWNSRSSDVMITATLGILVSLSAETTVTFEGQPWADTTVTLAAGSNLIGLPLNDARVTNISDIAGLFGTGVVTNVIVSSGGEFQLVAAAGDPADGPVAGDAAYLVMASTAGSATLTGDGWSNGTASAAPIALLGYTVDNQTPALNVHGSVVDEITGLAKEGFRVKVKNLSTKLALSHITEEAADGYDMTFVDLADSYAARVGDVLEITADSPDPLIGVQPVRHIVTVDDVKNSTIQLEELIAYEIPAETELLRNYPNPFNPETWIPYRLAEDANVSLTIYDTSGALVRSIDIGHQTAAVYETRAKALYWDGRNQFGEQVASGIYFYSLSAGDFSATRRMVILK